MAKFDREKGNVGHRGGAACEKGYGHGRDSRKAKPTIPFPFGKGKKELVHKIKKRGSGSKIGGGGGRSGCYLCCTRPQTSESPKDSQTSDPNNPEFTYELLKALMENNDFYSRECNPHLNVPPSTLPV